MKKILALILFVFTIVIGGTVAYAQTESSTVTPNAALAQPAASDTKSHAKIDKNDPLYIELQKKNEERKGLIEQQKQISEAIKAQDKTNRDLRAQIKGKAGDKDSKAKIKQAQEQINALGIQMADIHSGILSLRASKEKEWVQFHDAMKVPDLADANTHMQNIVNFKKEIISKLSDALNLKKQIGDILNNLLASLPQ